MKIILVTFVIAFVYTVKAQQGTAWIKSIQREGESVYLNCSDPDSEYHKIRFVPKNYSTEYVPQGWLLPNLTIVRNLNFTDGTISLLEDGNIFLINQTYQRNLGPYFCLTRSKVTGQRYMLKWGINMRGPYFEDLWQKYRLNTIIGLSVSGGFIVLVLLVWSIYHFRYREPEALTYTDHGLRPLMVDSPSYPQYGTGMSADTVANGGVANSAYVGDTHVYTVPTRGTGRSGLEEHMYTSLPSTSTAQQPTAYTTTSVTHRTVPAAPEQSTQL